MSEWYGSCLAHDKPVWLDQYGHCPECQRNACQQCGRPRNPVAVMLGPICGTCARANHKRAMRAGGR